MRSDVPINGFCELFIGSGSAPLLDQKARGGRFYRGGRRSLPCRQRAAVRPCLIRRPTAAGMSSSTTEANRASGGVPGAMCMLKASGASNEGPIWSPSTMQKRRVHPRVYWKIVIQKQADFQIDGQE